MMTNGRTQDYAAVKTTVPATVEDEENDDQYARRRPFFQQLDVTEATTSTTTTRSVGVGRAANSLSSDDDEDDDDDNSPSVSFSEEIITITVDDAIERLGTGKFQAIVLVAAGLCFAADAMQVLLLSFLSEVLKVEWNLGPNETAMITSILFVGAIFGTLTLGPAADKYGRKPIFLLAASIISGFGLATAFTTTYWPLLGNLFMVGWGVGGLVVPFDILSEFLPSDSRGKNLLVIEYFWTIGVLFVVVVAKITLGDGGSNGGGEGGNEDLSHESSRWREFVVICTIPCWFSVVIGFCCVPESPRWLCTQGRTTEAVSLLRQAAVVNGLDISSLFPPGLVLEDEEEEHSDFCELLSTKWRWTTLKLWGAWGCFAFGYYGVLLIITDIFNSEERQRLLAESESRIQFVGDVDDGGQYSMTTTTTTTSYNFDYGAIFVSSSAELVGTTIAILSIDRTGRIPLQIVSYTLAGVSVCALCFAASNHAHRSVLIAFGFAARIFEMIGSCVSWVSTAEILTTDVRTTGHSAANAIARIGSLFAPFLIEGETSLVQKGLVMLTIHAGTVLFVSQLPETMGTHMGRSHVNNNVVADDVSDDDDQDGLHLAETHTVNNEDFAEAEEFCHVPSTSGRLIRT